MVMFLLVMMSGILWAQTVPEYMYFKFDAAGNQQNYASAPVGTNPAILTGLTTGSTGQFGTALIGNGLVSTSNNLSTGWVTNMPAAGWTISFWVNNFPLTAATTYYYFGDATGATFRCFTGGVAGNDALMVRGTGWTDLPITGIPTTPTVIHIVYTGSSARVFFNGVLQGTPVAEPSINLTGTGPFLVGGYNSSNSFSAGTLMDEFRMYNRALTDAEVASTWNISLPGGGASTGTLSGTVTNASTSAPIAGATITVGALNTISAANGTYTLLNVPVGSQTATCSATGFNTQNQTVTITANNTTTQNFQMVATGSNITVIVGTDVINCNYPYTTYWMGGRTQLLYTAAQLTAAGAQPGSITSIGFSVISNSTQTMQNFNINMQNTTASTITSWVTSGMTNCYSGAYAVPGTGWQMITLMTPFAWNGQNLLLEVCFGNNGAYTSYSYVNGTTAPAGQIMPYWMDNTVGCTYTGAPYTGYTGLPNLRFVETPISPGTLTGTVTNFVGGAPVAGATVTVGAMTPVLTNASGIYTVLGINPGTVTVNITKTGFVPYNGSAVITSGGTTTLNVALLPNPNITGMVTDASTGLPIIGATVTIDAPSPTNPPVTWTVAGGIIPVTQVSVTGTHNFYVNKTGYDQFQGSVVLTAGQNATITAALLPTAVQPGLFTAALNNPTTPTAVNLNWVAPQGMYQVIYDDGLEDNFAIWAAANNLNAMKFTPLSWPVKLVGGLVDLGKSTDYPANALPFTNFTMFAYKADGPGGVPGTMIDSIVVTATAFGWASFTFNTPLTFTSGDFYLVMKQGGVPPHAAGIAVDLTNTQLRSYSKFVTGGGPWVPAAGNFMLRAIVQGIGGPTDFPVANKNLITAGAVDGLIYQSPVATVTGYEGNADYPTITPTYQVWRLQQGQEGTQASWTTLWTGATTTTVDNSWPSLACGAYRWAVEAIYSPPGQRFSPPTFSNVIGKCWTASVNVCATLTCAANPKAGTTIKLTNVAYPDTNYTKTTDTSGCVHFTNVWKGNYVLTATRFTYPIYSQNVTIMADANLNITLLQNTDPPTNLVVNDQSLHASWSPPRTIVNHLNEDWSSGSFATNQWVATGGNWSVTTGGGNPAPAAEFNWTPEVTNYDQYLTSKSMAGIHAPQMRLKYDIYLNNFSTNNVNTMAVELWNGTTWTVLKSYTNMNGSIPWTSEDLDITSQTNNPAFKIRFHAAGADSYDINWWYIDNIKVYSTDGSNGPNPCVIGYNVYLNNILTGFTPDTLYNIPPNLVVYNQVYTACVKAVYGSGYSNPICVTFTAHFLYPARNLTATGIECSVYLTWMKPQTSSDDSPHVPMFTGVVDHTPPDAGLAPMSAYKTDPNQQNADNPLIPLGSTAFGCDAITTTPKIVTFDINNINGMTTIVNNPLPDFVNGIVYPLNVTTYVYASAYNQNILYKLDVATGAMTTLGPLVGLPGGFAGITVDPTTGTYYGNQATNGQLYKFDPTALTATLIGSYGPPANLMIGITCDATGALWGHDIGSDNFFSINKTTGVATVVGPLGFNANYAQSEFYDQATSKVIMGAYNLGTGAAEIRAVDVTTGASVILSSGAHEITAAGIPITSGPGTGSTPYGLKGYRVYRDNVMVHQVLSPDTLSWYDYNLNPGTYKYDVKALYDLTTYGIPTPPNPWGESLMNTAGLQSVTLNCGVPLPFYEPWTSGNFAFNSWTYPSTLNHWSVNTGIGNPAPCADFTWQPALTPSYTQALTSEVINASAWTCAAIWLDFDVKLLDRNVTGKEKLTIDVYYNGSWHQKAELTNNGSTGWVSKHIDISSVKGKSFRVRFVANGLNSADILHWYVDNIHAYGICKAPTTLAGSQAQFTTTLTWHAPDCGPSGNGTIVVFIFDDGTWENGWVLYAGNLGWFGNDFPIAAATTGVIQKVSVYFVDNGTGSSQQLSIDFYNPAHVLLGSSALFTAAPVNTWIDVPINDVPFTGEFFAMVKFNMTPAQAYYFATDENGPYAAQDLGWNQNAAGVWAKASTLGGGPCVFLERVTALVAGDLKSVELIPGAPMPAGVKSDAKGVGRANVSGDSHNYMKMGPLSVSSADSSILSGYNVYRTGDTGIPPFTKLNTSPVTATTYLDVHPSTTPLGSSWKYYVTTLFLNSFDQSVLCEASSDTITILFPATGINELGSGQIMIYPNPATEVVNMKSDYTINRVDVINFVGQTVYTNSNVDSKTAKIDVTTFKAGVYFVKVSTSEGVRTVKITVTH